MTGGVDRLSRAADQILRHFRRVERVVDRLPHLDVGQRSVGVGIAMRVQHDEPDPQIRPAQMLRHRRPAKAFGQIQRHLEHPIDPAGHQFRLLRAHIGDIAHHDSLDCGRGAEKPVISFQHQFRAGLETHHAVGSGADQIAGHRISVDGAIRAIGARLAQHDPVRHVAQHQRIHRFQMKAQAVRPRHLGPVQPAIHHARRVRLALGTGDPVIGIGHVFRRQRRAIVERHIVAQRQVQRRFIDPVIPGRDRGAEFLRHRIEVEQRRIGQLR